MTKAQLISVLRLLTIFFLLGDQIQRGPTALSKSKDNPFVRQFQNPFYVRFVDNGHSYIMLREVMRGIAGLE